MSFLVASQTLIIHKVHVLESRHPMKHKNKILMVFISDLRPNSTFAFLCSAIQYGNVMIASHL